MKQNKRLIGILLTSLLATLFYMNYHRLNEVNVKAEEQVRQGSQSVHENRTLQAIVEEAQNSPDIAEYIQSFSGMADEEFMIEYDGGFFGSPAASKEEFYQRALEFDNGQGVPLNIEDVVTVGEIREALQVFQINE